jgi:hypothetical protein
MTFLMQIFFFSIKSSASIMLPLCVYVCRWYQMSSWFSENSNKKLQNKSLSFGWVCFWFYLNVVSIFASLSFTVPPKNITIFGEEGAVVSNSVVGPYKEGSSVNVTCMSTGGKYFSHHAAYTFHKWACKWHTYVENLTFSR